MESHNDTAVAEAPPEPAVEQIPNATPEEPASFSDAIDAALSKLSGEETVNSEPTPEPAPEPVSQAESTPEPAEVQSQETPEADNSSEAESQPEEATDKSPLESLSEDVDDWTPKAANRFKQLKGELKSSRTELEGLQQTVKEQDLKIKEMTGLVENRDIDQLQDAVANYEYDRAFEELEDTAAYQQAVTEP